MKKYFIVGIILLIVLFLLVVLFAMKKNPGTNTTPSSTTPFISPTPYAIPSNPQSSLVSPSPIPVPSFTGVNESQTFPADVQKTWTQKIALRDLTPLTFPFGVIDFDYSKDKFTLTLNEPKAQSKTLFTTWLQQTYPALTEDQFIFN
jgi:hypothetical protein